jgi:hypothetical protein
MMRCIRMLRSKTKSKRRKRKKRMRSTRMMTKKKKRKVLIPRISIKWYRSGDYDLGS